MKKALLFICFLLFSASVFALPTVINDTLNLNPRFTSPPTGYNFYVLKNVSFEWDPPTPPNCVFNITIFDKNNSPVFSINTTNSSYVWESPSNLSNGWYTAWGYYVCQDFMSPGTNVTLRKVETFLPTKPTSANYSYFESFIAAPLSHVFGNTETGRNVTAILIIGFFLSFVSFQNIRIEAKAVIMIPALILATAFVGWLSTLIALGVGILFYLALGRLFNK